MPQKLDDLCIQKAVLLNSIEEMEGAIQLCKENNHNIVLVFLTNHLNMMKRYLSDLNEKIENAKTT